ncbi:tetratricopeptide repeat protein [Leptospira alexanderi]|uniref:tetratricopeptide repeat protein n=1 Tax=Leptospira alexanderi TaxID=100053 RepID=UPI00099122C8|nr:tetratricopeptide repeat protein [Leptospira alexanderi]
MKLKLNSFLVSKLGAILHWVLFFLFTLSSGIVSQDSKYSGSHENGKKFLEEKRYSEAEKLALSLLSNNPSDHHAEYLLSAAWVGLGREEANKGNHIQAIELLQKARQKWPFDQQLKTEIDLLRTTSAQKRLSSSSSQNRKPSGPQTVVLLDSELFRSIDDLKSELHSTLSNLKEIDSFKKESDSFSKREKLYLGIISVLALVSLLNLVFTFLLWKRK